MDRFNLLVISFCFWINLLIASESLPSIDVSPVLEIGGLILLLNGWLETSVGNATRDGRVVNSSTNKN